MYLADERATQVCCGALTLISLILMLYFDGNSITKLRFSAKSIWCGKYSNC